MSSSESDNETIFSLLSTKFPENCEKIKTVEFLEASKGVVTLIECFGKVFAPVIYDLNGNIKKLTQKYIKNQNAHEYLEDMILLEKEEGSMIATDALLWLRRGLDFLGIFFQLVVKDSKNNITSSDLSSFVKKAYAETLEEHHGWLGTQLFSILSRFSPSRQHLLHKLALEKPDKDHLVLEEMDKFSANIESCVQHLTEFYDNNNLG